MEGKTHNMANTHNYHQDQGSSVERQCSYKEFMSCQPINFKGTKGAIGLIRWFKQTKSVFSHCNCTEDYKVKFATGNLTKEALSWWNSFAQPIRIEEAYKMHAGFFQGIGKLYCPTMVPDSEKMMEVFIGGLPRSIEGNVTASKSQTLEEAINIAQRLIDQKGHYANQCRKTTNNNAQGRAYMLRDRNAYQDPNIVTGTNIYQKGQNKDKTDKTKHENGKSTRKPKPKAYPFSMD
ncbi:hypothetical protein Tco_0687873 [Tanacetum coccineum]